MYVRIYMYTHICINAHLYVETWYIHACIYVYNDIINIYVYMHIYT